MVRKLNRRDLVFFFIALYIFFELAVSIQYISDIPYKITLFVVIGILFSYNLYYRSKINFLLCFLSILLIILSYINIRCFVWPKSYILIPFLFLFKIECLSKIYDYFIKIIIITSIPAIIVLIAYILGFENNLPFLGLTEGERSFLLYPGIMVQPSEIINFGKFEFFRFPGIMDEPGRLGTIVALILVGENYNFNKRINILLLFLGIISFSFAFYILTIIGFSLKLLRMKKNKEFLFLLVILFAFYLFIYNSTIYNFFIAERISEIDFSRNISSQNIRTNISSSEFFSFFFSQDIQKILIGNGMGVEPIVSEGGGSTSYYVLFYNHGLLTVCLYLIILILSFKKTGFNKTQLIFVVLFIFSIYQRPQVISNSMFLIYLGVLYKLQSSNK